MMLPPSCWAAPVCSESSGPHTMSYARACVCLAMQEHGDCKLTAANDRQRDGQRRQFNASYLPGENELAACKTLAKRRALCKPLKYLRAPNSIATKSPESYSSPPAAGAVATEGPASCASSSLRGRMSPIRNDPRWRARYSSPVAWSGRRANVRSIVCFQRTVR